VFQKENKSIREVSKFYENEFFANLSSLNIEKPSIVLRVTDHLPQIIGYIEKLVDSKHAYVAAGGSVYFDTKAHDRRFFTDFQNSPNELGKTNTYRGSSVVFIDKSI
jgi:cysteinyl-tRNA synthetase